MHVSLGYLFVLFSILCCYSIYSHHFSTFNIDNPYGFVLDPLPTRIFTQAFKSLGSGGLCFFVVEMFITKDTLN